MPPLHNANNKSEVKPSELLKVLFPFRSKIANVCIGIQGQLDSTQKAVLCGDVLLSLSASSTCIHGRD